MAPRRPSRPLVTAVIAARDAGRWVGGALGSLCAQTLGDLEVVAVDDGSTDGTWEAIRGAARADRRIRPLRSGTGRGQAAALNAGLAAARGRYLAILDADDEAVPDRLALQVRALERDPRLVLVGGAVRTWCGRHEAGGRVWRYAAGDAAIRARTLFKSEFISGAMTFDLARFRPGRLRFDERVRVGADWAASIAAMREGRVANLREVVLRYRIHPGQMTAGMVDDLDSDGARIRARLLAWAGVRPTRDELRTHLAVSPCAYWPYGSHPWFRARRATVREEAARWLARLVAGCARTGRVPAGALRAYAAGIQRRIDRCLREPEPAVAAPPCPVSAPRRCLAGDPCR